MRQLAFLLAAVLLPTLASAQSLINRLDDLGASPCWESELTCLTVDVPRDHFANDLMNTTEITFAIHTAWSGASDGVLLVAVGGPGYSGLRSADDYIDSFGDDVLDRMDVVFFDQRGVGRAGGLNCPAAQTAFDTAEKPRADPDRVIALTKTYVARCFVEIGFSSSAPYAATEQVIRDIDYFRRAIGEDKLWIYGESYGTQVAQEYAVTFPDHVAGIILDGVVDLSLSLKGFGDTYVDQSTTLLNRLFAACDERTSCRRDMGGSARAAYDELFGVLTDGPAPVALAFREGELETRDLTRGMLEMNAFFALYEPYTRAEFLRALAKAANGDMVPMLQLAYLNQSVESDTLALVEDDGWFGAAYNAITCADYDDETGGDTSRADTVARQILAEAEARAVTQPWFADLIYLDRVICAYWPVAGRPQRPQPFAGSPDYPTLILNSDADPITPLTMARAVYDRSVNASLVVMEGGPHVIYARGFGCPDVIVERFLAGEAPEGKIQHCRQDLIGDYVPLTLTQPGEVSDPMAIGEAIETELAESIALKNWDFDSERIFGCAHGGTLIGKPAADWTVEYEFVDCRLWPDIALTGFAAEADQDGSDLGFWANVSVSGAATGTFTYVSNHDTEARRITGTWAGAPITE